MSELRHPEGHLIVSDGLGVNSVALQLVLWEHGIVPRAITSANPGSERSGSERFYDLDEQRRVDKAGTIAWKPDLEEARFGSWYPLYELGMDRDACVAKIREHFPNVEPPPKSACTFCPNNTLDEWKQLRREEPERFAAAVSMSRNARLDSPDVVGLMRCNPHGKRQLHVWADGGYPGLPPDDPEDMAEAMPCECAT